MAFAALACALLAFLFRDAWLHGYVLGQADILFDELPWQQVRPPGWRVRNPLLGDIPTVFFPFLFHARSEILHGHFPLWSSGMGGGQPFFGAMQSAVLSPFTVLDYILPFPAGFTVDAAARLFAGGLGMYLFLRALPLGSGAAVFGGVAYLLNPFSIVWLEHPLSAVAAWLPWLLLAVETCARRLDGRSFAGVAIATALLLITGHPETAFKILLLGGAYALYAGWTRGLAIRTTVLVASGMLLGVLVSALQLVPFIEYAQQSRILELRSSATAPLFTSPATSFVTAFVPDFFGTPLRRNFVIAGNYCEQQIYSGLVTWVLAAMAMVPGRHRGRAIFFIGAGAIAALIMYGTPIARAATWSIPPLRVAALSRFGLIAITGMCIAGAIGLDAFLARPLERRLVVVGTLAAAGIALVVLVFLVQQRAFLVSAHHWNATLRSTRYASVFLLAVVGLLLAAPQVARPIAAAAFTAVLAVNLLWYADGFHPLMPPQLVFPATPEIREIQKDPEVFRIAGWKAVFLPNTALVYGLRDVRGYDGIGVRQYSDLLDVAFAYTGSTHHLLNVSYPQLLDLLNIKYVMTPPDLDLPRDRFDLVLDGSARVYRNNRVQPRAFLVDHDIVLRGTDALRAMRDTVDLTHTAVLDAPLDAGLEPDPAGGAPGRASLHRYDDAVVSISTRAEGRRLLVLTDVHYPGWIATVDGVEVPILRADFAFRAVSVPAGEHSVEFRYRPASVYYGGVGSVLGVVIVAFASLPFRGRRRRHGRQDGNTPVS